MIILAVDAGTTVLKAALVNERGQAVAMQSMALQVLHPFSHACEMDMEAFYDTFCGVVCALREAVPKEFSRISGVGVCAQGDGLWPLRADHRPAGHALLWNDTRAHTLGLERDEVLSDFLVNNNSTAMFSGAYPALLLWLKKNDAEAYHSIAHVLHCKDWLNFRLTGEIASDYTDQSTASINIFQKIYVPALFDRLDIPEMKHALPPLFPSTHLLGAITVQAQSETDIRAGTPVISGCIDVVAAAIGAGMQRAGDSCCILGTTLCNEVALEQRQVHMRDTTGSVLCGIFPDSYIRVMAALNGTSVLDWARDVFCPDMPFTELEAALEGIPAGSGGVLFHPYLRGERAPFREPGACGGFYGLRAGHTRMHMLRAVYEGLALSILDCFTHLPRAEGPLYVSGGGAQSALLCGLIAGALNKTVLRPVNSELGIRGIAKATLMALGERADWQQDAYEEMRSDAETGRVLQAQFSEFQKLRQDMYPYYVINREPKIQI